MIPAVVDYETYWGPDYTLSKMTTESYIRDSRFRAHGAGIKIGQGNSIWVPRPHLPAVFARIPWEQTALVGHHLNFDGGILNWHYGHRPKRYIDTLGLSRALVGVNTARHGLEYIAPILTGLTKYPGFLKETYGVRDLPSRMEETLALYCAGPIDPTGQYAGDVLLTWELLRKLLPLMPADELDALNWTIKIFTEPKVSFDYDMLVKYNIEVKETKAEAMRSVDDMIVEYMDTHKVKVAKGKDPKKTVIRSNDHYATLMRTLGVEPPTKLSLKAVDKEGNPKVSYAFAKTDEAHKQLLEHPDVKVQALVAARLEVKSSIEETRSQSYLEAATRGAWPIHLNYAGAHTIRFSGGRGAGGNPQNLKRGGTLRDAICAQIGKIFFVCDLSQIEARITLWIGSKMPDANAEAEALEIMRTGGDIYAYFGSIIYGMEITKKTHPYERQVAKSAVLGLGFGMGWKRFIDYCKQNGVYNMTEDEAKRIVRVYRSMFKGVVQSWKYIQDVVLPALMDGNTVNFPNDETAFATTGIEPLFKSPCINMPGGLRLIYPGIDRNEDGQWSYRTAKSKKPTKIFGGFILENIVQFLAGRILRTQIVKIEKQVPSVEIVTNTHDELLMQIDDREELEQYREQVAEALSRIAAGEAGVKMPKLPMTPEREAVEAIMTEDVDFITGCPLAVESDYGYRYGDAK